MILSRLHFLDGMETYIRFRAEEHHLIPLREYSLCRFVIRLYRHTLKMMNSDP